jgi:hypothetical protein
MARVVSSDAAETDFSACLFGDGRAASDASPVADPRESITRPSSGEAINAGNEELGTIFCRASRRPIGFGTKLSWAIAL